MNEQVDKPDTRYGYQHLSVELTNICNLHCGYCLRDEDALYHSRTEFISPGLLQQILSDAQQVAGFTHVGFTGGEPTLHPNFAEIIDICGAVGFRVSFVTNGWNFEKLWPMLLDRRESLNEVSFSLDGSTPELHDRWRGQGSFLKIIQAFSRCSRFGIPFSVKVGIRRDTIEHLEELALFAARLGATALNFAHIMPTSQGIEADSALTIEERRHAEEEIALLARIFKMKIGIDVGYYNLDPSAPCSSLAGTNCNIDYKGRLSLCCNLSGFRGAESQGDIVADLNVESFAEAYRRLRMLAELQLEKRRNALREFERREESPDLYSGSPCLFCLQSFGKIPWHSDSTVVGATANRALPVVNANSRSVSPV